MQPQGLVTEFARVAKENPAAEEEFPANQVKESRPWQANCVRLVIVMHRRITTSQIINDRSHKKNTDGRDDEPSLPVAKRQPKLLRVFSKQKNNDNQRNNKIQNDAVPIFFSGE